MKKRIVSVLIALFVALTPLTAFADDEVEFDTTATQTEVVAALYDTVADGVKVSIDAFAASLEAAGWVWDALTGTYYDPLNNIEYGILLNGLLGRSDRSGGGGRVRVESAADVKISGKTFSEICEQLQSQYAPDVSNSYISWQTETHSKASYQLTFYQYGEGLPTGTAECYLVPFYRDGDKFYFSKYEYCFTVVDGVLKCSYKDILDNPDGEFTEDSNINISLAEYPYVQLCCMPSYQNYNLFMPFTHEYKVYSDFVGMSNIHATTGTLINSNCGDYYASTDITSVVGILDVSSKFMSKPTGDEDYDLGFVIDSEYMSFDGWVQPIPVADDDLITLTGDTIYDYSITNTEGDTTTINNYITNNYVIPETPDDDTGSGEQGSGTTSGNITVGGNIDVGGSVDININVNTSTGTEENDTTSSDPYEYIDPNVNEALEQIPELGDGFIDFMTNVFSWLPPEVLGLFVGGIGLAIVCRLAGR